MNIDEAMKIRRCIRELSTGRKTLDELVNAVGLDDGETQDDFYAFLLMLVVANLVSSESGRFVLSDAFIGAAAYRLAEVYGGRRVYVKSLKAVEPGEILGAICGGDK